MGTRTLQLKNLFLNMEAEGLGIAINQPFERGVLHFRRRMTSRANEENRGMGIGRIGKGHKGVAALDAGNESLLDQEVEGTVDRRG